MFKENFVDKILRRIKGLIPRAVFNYLAPMYHSGLSMVGALIYGFPSRSMKVIGVTGTKGKSTTVSLITKILEGMGHKVAAVGSLGFKIKDKEWPNTLKMTMPGRMKLQKFLFQAKSAGCEYVLMEVTSEGIAQKRHLGIQFDCAVFTNLHKEHIESHGSFENYYQAKQELFKLTQNIHVLNADDPHIEKFSMFKANKKIFYGIGRGDLFASKVVSSAQGSTFDVYGTQFDLHLGGRFNVYNALAALATCAMYGIDLPSAQPILEKVESLSGRMEWIQTEPFGVVIDYAHTPDSLENVYVALKNKNKLICVLGAAGGGRDKWKRPEFGKIAEKYCDEIILTNEDPYDENPNAILEDIKSGISPEANNNKLKIILDRKDAIHRALTDAANGDIVAITGKGSETSMALGQGKKIPWSDSTTVKNILDDL